MKAHHATWDGDEGKMGFGIRIMPGVRISASSRGLSAGLGPRIARVHVGSRGGVGVSSGLGPLSAYTSVTGSRRSSPSRTSLAAYERELRRAQREAEIQQVADIEHRLLTAHLQEFPPARRPTAPRPDPVDRDEILRRHLTVATRGLSIFRWGERRRARTAARQAAELEIAALESEREGGRREAQRELDRLWDRLNANEPPVVLTALEAAFEDNAVPAAPIDCQEDRVTLAMIYGTPDLVPERRPALTPGGRPTLKKRTKTERNELYAESMASSLLATVREAFATAPAINTVAAVVARRERDPTGAPRCAAVYCGEFTRDELRRSIAQSSSPLTTIVSARHALVNPRGRTQELAALDLDDEPEVRHVLEHLAQALGLAPPAPPEPRSRGATDRSEPP